MKGIWDLTTRTVDPGLGVAIFDGLVALVVILFTCISMATRSKYWPAAWLLHVGMLLLSMYVTGVSGSHLILYVNIGLALKIIS
jgi:hypothetical protein